MVNETLQQVLAAVLLVMAGAVVIALFGLLLLMRRIRRLRIPREADFFTTMRLIPFSLVVLLDLLDLGLDVFAAPIAWIVLDRMGLPNLRNKATVEALIPFSGPLPTFTLAWIAARLLNLGSPEMLYYLDQVARMRPARRPPPGRAVIDVDDYRVR